MENNYYKEIDNDIKVSKYYDSERMKSAIMNMEQFYALSQNKKLDEKHTKCAYKLFEHYRRLAVCILMKEFSPDFSTDCVITVDYMNNMFKE